MAKAHRLILPTSLGGAERQKAFEDLKRLDKERAKLALEAKRAEAKALQDNRDRAVHLRAKRFTDFVGQARALRFAADPLAGSELGCLFLLAEIDEQQHQAGLSYLTLTNRLRCLCGLPGAVYEDCDFSGFDQEDLEEDVNRKKAELNQAINSVIRRNVLDRNRQRPLRGALDKIVLENRRDDRLIPALNEALSALCDFWA